jgi:hypothetical protein
VDLVLATTTIARAEVTRSGNGYPPITDFDTIPRVAALHAFSCSPLE